MVLRAMPGAPGGVDDTDVALEFSMDDVFTNALADYTGELRASDPLAHHRQRQHARARRPGCAPRCRRRRSTWSCPARAVRRPQRGLVLHLHHDRRRLVPGAATEGRRGVWALGRIAVYDGGADGDANTPAGDTLFATQGVFIP